ncbi:MULTISPECIES: relaxase/mobilization nuclease domain-containing protein [unclassified Flavobacterium]|uniref:relaxase/mobilization nuclease domain-containing protein n=1 Tax=unclassified Flavobacterium TaxID=196869 RepID=UPI00057F81D5|nr:MULTISPECIES: relaxase/mobilization nuclease domain-containing protein [unclassified Flavobacterium]KIA95617.1 relaxase [Flavobacterium sp. KMS]OUL63443.1 relaxase [Flavobacterium sp. AJR]
MVAIIKSTHSIRGVFYYNENKVKKGAAECITAGNFPTDIDKMTDTMKLNRFIKRVELNENVKCNTLHISLNFDPSENHSKEKLIAIAERYMEKIGFGEQPYLVYQHSDTKHQHLHVVSINIEKDGKRIDLHNIGMRKSEPARKEIEEHFGLVKAEGRKKNEEFSLEPISMGSIQYGKIESKKAIFNVLNTVVNHYKYESLAELNAVLKLYNVMADRGSENSKMFLAGGLVYHILNAKGKPIGVPIKASSFYTRPTLKFLEEKFKNNEVRNMSDKSRVKSAIDMALLREPTLPLTELSKRLEKEGISTLFRKNSEGLLYGITYVDHVTKNVFNGSSLGKQYSAKAIQERCGLKVAGEEKRNQIYERLRSKKTLINVLEQQKNILTIPDMVKVLDVLILEEKQYFAMVPQLDKIIDNLMQSEQINNYLSYQLKNKKKMQRRKRLSR